MHDTRSVQVHSAEYRFRDLRDHPTIIILLHPAVNASYKFTGPPSHLKRGLFSYDEQRVVLFAVTLTSLGRHNHLLQLTLQLDNYISLALWVSH